MYSASNPIILDKNSIFFDSNKIFYKNQKNKTASILNFKNVWLYNIEQNNLTNKYNYFEKNIFNISIFVGLNSSYCNNNILNSSVYFNDNKIEEQKYKPYNENNSYKGNNISTSLNPVIISKTYGQQNPDPVFEKLAYEPFEDTSNIENVQNFIDLPLEEKYPKYFNYYSLSRLNSNISVFGTLEEIDGTLLTEKSLKGITCEIISKSLDARGRAVNFSSNVTLLENKEYLGEKQKHTIESYSDEEYTDVVTSDDVLLKRSFNYVNKIVNGQLTTVLDTSDSTTSLIPNITNKIIFYTEDDYNISPFIDRNIIDSSNQKSNSDYNIGSIYPAHGHDKDKSQGSGPDSFAYMGELD